MYVDILIWSRVDDNNNNSLFRSVYTLYFYYYRSLCAEILLAYKYVRTPYTDMHMRGVVLGSTGRVGAVVASRTEPKTAVFTTNGVYIS